MLGAVTPKSRAMVGSAVVSTVASSCSMNMALAMMSAMVRKLGSAEDRRCRRPEVMADMGGNRCSC